MVVVVRAAATVEGVRAGALVEEVTREERTAVEREHLRGAKVAYSEAMVAKEAKMGEAKAGSRGEVAKAIEMVEGREEVGKVVVEGVGVEKVEKEVKVEHTGAELVLSLADRAVSRAAKEAKEEKKAEKKGEAMVVVVRGEVMVEAARVDALVEGGTREERMAVERERLQGAKVAHSEAMVAKEVRRGEAKADSRGEVVKAIEMVGGGKEV